MFAIYTIIEGLRLKCAGGVGKGRGWGRGGKEMWALGMGGSGKGKRGARHGGLSPNLQL